MNAEMISNVIADTICCRVKSVHPGRLPFTFIIANYEQRVYFQGKQNERPKFECDKGPLKDNV